MNRNLSNQRFEGLLGQRMRFVGTYDGFKENFKVNRHKKYFRFSAIFKNVFEKSSGDEFRDHVHIQVPEKIFNKYFKDLEPGTVDFEFTAEIYEYLQPMRTHRDGLTYKTISIGLRNLTKLEKRKDKK